MKALKYIAIIITIGIYLPNLCAQQLCNNPLYEKTIDSYIDRSIPIITTDTLSTKLDEYIILDAREFEEYQVSHIPNAYYLGYENPRMSVLDIIDKDKPIVVYCSIGYRSEKMGEMLKEKGFMNIHNLYGSIFEWANDNYPLEDKNGQNTKVVHAYSKLWGKWIENDSIEKKYN